jgi:hypothetical protein
MHAGRAEIAEQAHAAAGSQGSPRLMCGVRKPTQRAVPMSCVGDNSSSSTAYGRES